MTNTLLSKFIIPSSFTIQKNRFIIKPKNIFEDKSDRHILRPISTLTKSSTLFTQNKFNCYAVSVVSNDQNQIDRCWLDLQLKNVPKHVAIILDGSRRWLKAHGKPLSYDPFFDANLLFADLCIKWNVGTATSFVYSLKNLERGEEANNLIFEQLEKFIEHNTQQFRRKGIKIRVIGERRELTQSLQNKIRVVEEATKDCTNLEFMLAVCYAGTRDIVRATKNICHKVSNGKIEAEAIDELLLENELSTGGSRAPDIDLVIRTGGRIRVSDYLMWQMAQAELYFSDLCAPEFGEIEFVKALHSFQQRERTFGK
ncbi:hypothetical protein vseg_006077 [Gypsophila vaccaria]